jgi:hypothetical protein
LITHIRADSQGLTMTVPAMRAPAVAADERPGPTGTPLLSTDYLNRYGEALMLIEMAPMDGAVVEELRAWRAVGYREHFLASSLRCAADALAAYDRLDAGQREAFEDLCKAMSRLIATVTALLGDKDRSVDIAALVEVASASLRSLISRGTQFINANGAVDIAEFHTRSLQDEIDALFAR